MDLVAWFAEKLGTYLESFSSLHRFLLFCGSIHNAVYDSTALVIFISGIVIVVFTFIPDYRLGMFRRHQRDNLITYLREISKAIDLKCTRYI